MHNYENVKGSETECTPCKSGLEREEKNASIFVKTLPLVPTNLEKRTFEGPKENRFVAEVLFSGFLFPVPDYVKQPVYSTAVKVSFCLNKQNINDCFLHLVSSVKCHL